MATNPPEQKVTDYMAEAVSPALITALVGSLVYFLVEVLYVGEYSGQLLWGLSFFVFAAVLIARMSIEQGTGKATVYAACLALPVWLTLQFYVEYPEDSLLAPAKAFVNLGLIALIWWCAHRLTWDCTFLDDKADAGSEGLLQASGLETRAGTDDEEEAVAREEEKPRGWWQCYQRYRERQRRRHTPGTWVVYFSLAALPLFGLGQSLIPVEEVGRRRYVFWLMAVYVASGLGLLLTTTYLGLRRYLRQRQVRMPAAMTGAWLGMGAALIVGLLAVGALLPRPQAEYSLVSLAGAGSTKRQASRWAMRGGAPGKGEGRQSSQAPRDEPKDEQAQSGQGRKGEGPGRKSEQGDARGGSGSKDGSSSGDRQGNQGGGRSKGSGDDQGKQSGDRGSGRDREERSSRQTNSPASGQRNRSDSQRPKGQGQSGQQSSGNQSRASSDSGSSPPQGGSSFLQSLGSLLGGLAPILRWLVFAVFALVVLVLVLRGALQFLANFTNWARDLLESLRSWWQALFGWWPQGGGADTAAEEVREPAAPPVPFSAFRNPFHDGRAGQMSMPKLIRYSFEALEAWARERGVGRRPDETVLEFAARLGEEVPALEADARRLAALYAHVLYGRGPLPRNVR
ncbi:MAG TPA: DUF4129 domain-containing protein, partial [Gemmataceae bacterium]|nr:DUF4129 domain-containing protein [Gemmataceae bacterium]